MQTWLLSAQLSLLFFLLSYGCRQENNQATLAQSNQQIVLNDSTQLIAFDRDVVPLLKTRCSPCHFPGGKMYERMPFDKSKTITDHPDGVLKRFKEPELATVKAYLEQEKQ